MKQLLFTIFSIILFSLGLSAQEDEIQDPGSLEGNSKRKFSIPKEKIKRAPIEWYKIINIEKDTTYLDTTLSINKDYKYNYLRYDNFELISFANVGRPYIELAKQEAPYRTFPKFGSRARHFGVFDKESIKYYNVPTPLTDLYFKTAFEQGQQLDAFLTLNTSPNLNFSIAYKGVRSLGKFRSELTSTRAFRGTLSYNSPNQRYISNLHYVDQRITNQENGGLTPESAEDFLNADSEFSRRAVLDVNISNASNEIDVKRFYIDHEYRIIKKDTLQANQLSIAHIFNTGTKQFFFTQDNATPEFFGESQREGDFRDTNDLTFTENSLGFRYSNPYIGKVSFLLKNSFFNYSYNSIFIRGVEPNTETIPNLITDNLNGFTASYQNSYKGFLINAKAESTLVGDFKNQFFKGTARYQYNNRFAFEFGYQLKSEAPEINKLLNQSNYVAYNWFNNFENTVTNTLSAKLESKRFFNAEVSLSNINDYTYFSRIAIPNPTFSSIGNNNNSDIAQNIFASTPVQANESLQIIKIKASREFRYRNLRLTNTLLFQQVEGNTNNLIYNVPTFVTRNTLYYQNSLFKKGALFFQIGATLRYYSKYFTDGYDPIIGESFVQNTQEFGDTPLIDLFLNSRVRQTRIFFKLENFQYLFEQNNNFLTANVPSRDFVVRFGLVWNFFL